MNAKQEVACRIALMLGSLILSIICCLFLYGVWDSNQQQINREMTAKLIQYARVVSFKVPAPTFVIAPAPQPWYVTLF